jgi:hypothetical protein
MSVGNHRCTQINADACGNPQRKQMVSVYQRSPSDICIRSLGWRSDVARVLSVNQRSQLHLCMLVAGAFLLPEPRQLVQAIVALEADPEDVLCPQPEDVLQVRLLPRCGLLRRCRTTSPGCRRTAHAEAESAKTWNDLRAPATPVVRPTTASGPSPRCVLLNRPASGAINGFSAPVIPYAPRSLPVGVLGRTE